MTGYVGTADTGIKPPVRIFEAVRIGSDRFMMDEDAKYPRLSEPTFATLYLLGS